MESNEKQIIKDCLKGNRQAQEALYQKYASQMFAICLRYSKEQQEAEDILQEAFIKVFKQLGKFRGDAKVVFWIKKIVINTALNSQRSKLYLYPMVDIDDYKEEKGEALNPTDYTMEELLTMIKKLPNSSQIIFNLFAIEGYKHQEIAKQLGISVGTSKSQYARARQLLQDQMKELNKHYGRG
ncbi:MAG: sigma-70 family RNA polymerase sigma factor [Reichenbachiella sp.]